MDRESVGTYVLLLRNCKDDKKPEPEKYALRKESGDKYKLSELQTISNKNKNKNKNKLRNGGAA